MLSTKIFKLVAKICEPVKVIEKVVTQNGEVTINLNLTITVQEDGKVSVSSQKREEEEMRMQIPDFKSEPVLNDFGVES